MRIHENDLNEISQLSAFLRRYEIRPENELRLTLPPEIGGGTLTHEPMGDMALSTGCFRFNEPMELLHNEKPRVMGFCIMRQGAMFEKCGKEHYAFNPGQVYWTTLEGRAGVGICPAGGYDILQLRFESTLIEGWEGAERMRGVRDGAMKIYGTRPLDAELNRLADTLYNNPFHGMMGKLYNHGKARELMLLLLQRFSPRRKKQETDTTVLENAKQTLLSNLQEHPTITQLARTCGINQQKLKTGFKEHFGQSVYQTLLSARMEQAKALLRRGDISVQEAAYEVGYSNTSAFIAAFARHFGERPGEVRKRYHI